MCANIHSQNGTAILAQELLSRKWENLKVFLSTPSIRATAMSGAPVSFDRIIPEETQGPMPVEAPTTLASGSLDSFHHVEAVLKEENVSTGTLDSQDWEMVTEMVEDTDNAATHFLQGKHVVDLEGPAPNLQDSIDKMIETVEKMKLGSTADGVEAPSRPEGVASAAAVPSGDAAPMDDSVVEQTTHKWKVFGRGTSSPTFILADVPFQHEAVTKDTKQMVDKFSTEEIYDLFVKFCDSESIPAVSFGRVIKAYMAMKAQKVHDQLISNHMFQSAPVQGWVVIPCGSTLSLSPPHTNAPNASRIGPHNGIQPRRRCVSVGRWWCQSRRPSTWWTWTTPAATGCCSWLGMASHGCEMGSPRRMQRLPAAMSHPNRTRISNWGMRWILECWQKPHCVQQLTMPRPACQISCRARTGCNFALRYSTESLMLRPSHPKLRPGLRFPRTARRNRLLWCSTRMRLQPWPLPASWLGQMSLQKKPSIQRDQRVRCWGWCRIMPISCTTCRVALCQWRIRRGRRHCGTWIWSSLRRFWRGSSWWRVQGPTRVPGKRWTAAWWTLTQARPKTGSMRKPGGLTSSSWHHHLGTHPSGERISNNWSHDCRASTAGLSWQAFDWGPPVSTGHACGNCSPVISDGGQKIGARIPRSQGGPSSSHDQHVWWRDPTTCWQVEKVWVHGCPNLGQATPANLGRCTVIGTPHTPQRSRIQLCGVPHVHWWGAGGPQASGLAPLLVLLEGQLLCLWTCACRWRCRDLLGEGSPDMDFAYFGGDLWPSILPEAAVVCLGEPPHCCEKTQPRTTWWWSARSSRPHRGKEEDTIPTLSKDFQGVIPRPSKSDRGLRWLKEALVRQGVDQDLVTPLTWHSFRVFIPDCAYQLGIPTAQRQYLGNWQTESTADIYTREKRNVVVDIWSKVLGKIQEVDLQPGRMVREDLAHPDWDDKPLDKPGDTESVVDSNGFELVQSDAETGLIESEGGPNSASTQHTSSSRRTRSG